MEKLIVPSYVVALLLLLVLGGCEKKSGEAVVIGKDYVAAAKQGDEIKDERATNNEQWIVEVRMRDNGRTIQVRAGRAQWEKLRENDQVKVTYRVGKYTGTVWDADIE
jgi:hypothetical protein